MAEPHTKTWDYADALVDEPKAHLRLELAQDEEGLLLLHEGRPLVRCYLTEEGMLAGGFMSEALGVKLPRLGETVVARVSTGVLFRALSIASLDLGKEDSHPLLERWLQEARMQRGTTVSEA